MSWDAPLENLILTDDASLAAALAGKDLEATYAKKRPSLAKGHGYLHLAVWSLAPSAVSALLAAGADPNAKDSEGLTPLLVLAKRQKRKGPAKGIEALIAQMASALLGKGADVKACDAAGWTALHAAAAHGDVGLIQVLTQHGAPIDAAATDMADLGDNTFEASATALCVAAEVLKPKAITALLELGADPDLGSPCPLAIACRNRSDIGGLDKSIKPLVKRTSEAGRLEALFAAVGASNAEVVRMLLDAGVDIGAEHGGRTALMAVAVQQPGFFPDGRVEWRWSEVVDVLLDAGVDVNAHRAGWTALHSAAERYTIPLIEKLLARGARKDVRLTDGRAGYPPAATPADVARAKTPLQYEVGARERAIALLS